VKEQTVADWQSEMRSKYASSDDVAFVCPACGHIATAKEHVDAGGTLNNAPQQCIGRTTGKGTKNQKDLGDGCNWAAFGLFGTLGKGRAIVFPDDSRCEVFDFAPEREVPKDDTSSHNN